MENHRQIYKTREKIVRNYIDGYNEFDIGKMVSDFSENIIFQNILDDEVNMRLNGIHAFIKQAEQAKLYFENRRQQITNIVHSMDTMEIEINYFAKLATDFPNGVKKGDKLELYGKSIFKFVDYKIVEITDINQS